MTSAVSMSLGLKTDFAALSRPWLILLFITNRPALLHHFTSGKFWASLMATLLYRAYKKEDWTRPAWTLDNLQQKTLPQSVFKQGSQWLGPLSVTRNNNRCLHGFEQLQDQDHGEHHNMLHYRGCCSHNCRVHICDHVVWAVMMKNLSTIERNLGPRAMKNQEMWYLNI